MNNCWICGLPMLNRSTYPHPLARTTDHVIPKSAGGRYLQNNKKPAHYYCNKRRGIRRVTPEMQGIFRLALMELYRGSTWEKLAKQEGRKDN